MKVIIIECVSNGLFLIDDCRKLGFDPVVVFPPWDENDSVMGAIRESALQNIDKSVEVIFPKSVDDLIEKISDYDIKCIITGSEFGIPFADMLSHKMGLPCNHPDTTTKRTTKYGMHSALKDAGLRYIRQEKIYDKKGAEEFWRNYNPKKVVIKPDLSAGSFGLHVCDSLESTIYALDSLMSSTSWTGEQFEYILIQDYIEGDEYIVNTITKDGVHKITDVWKYTKIELGGGVVPIGVKTVTDPNQYEIDFASYALKVLDAVGIEYGPSHLEIKLDEDGPVLIEVNARPMGGHFSVSSLDAALNHHITDLALDIMCGFKDIKSLPDGIPKMRGMYMMVLIVYENRIVSLSPLAQLVRCISTFREIFSPLMGKGAVPIEVTNDYVSSIGSVEFISDDDYLLDGDFNVLWNIEEKMPDLIYGPTDPLPEVPKTDFILPDGKILLLEPNGFSVCEDGNHRKYVDGESINTCVVNLYGTMSLEELYSNLFECLDKLSDGGSLIVTKSSSMMVPYGMKGMMRLLMLMNTEYDLPDSDGTIVAVKHTM